MTTFVGPTVYQMSTRSRNANWCSAQIKGNDHLISEEVGVYLRVFYSNIMSSPPLKILFRGTVQPADEVTQPRLAGKAQESIKLSMYG